MDRGKSYNHTYDPLNRLLTGISNEGNNESLSYDVMGNIQSLTREHYAYGVVDQLSYSYSGNKLSSVYDANGNTNETFQLPGTMGYGYDINGNMTSRTNDSFVDNNINNISYNYLNLPSVVNSNGIAISYAYEKV